MPIGIAAGRNRRERAKLELLLTQLTSSLVWTTDADLVVTSAFGGALELIGVDGPRDLVGKSVAELTAPTLDGGAALLDAHRRASSRCTRTAGSPASAASRSTHRSVVPACSPPPIARTRTASRSASPIG